MEEIRISQCMIVKNEEKNIEKALTWAKDIVYEQIVVDTGSTDRTVQIAEEMGAKVFHFKWIDDFSAAKNYALDQAVGTWIIFCDADEYFTEEGTKLIPEIVKEVEEAHADDACTIRSNIISVGADGAPFTLSIMDRIFTKRGYRYWGAIHESLAVYEGFTTYKEIATDRLNIIHTGYSTEVYADQKKLERNKEILFEQLEKDPGSPGALMYLGDCYGVENNYEKAEECYRNSIAGCDYSEFGMMVLTWDYWGLLRIYLAQEDDEKFMECWKEAILVEPGYSDFYHLRGAFEFKNKNWESAIRFLEKALIKEENYKGIVPRYTPTVLKSIFISLVNASGEIKDHERIFKYTTLTLKIDKYNLSMLLIMLGEVSSPERNCQVKEIMDLLSSLYDLNNSKDRLFTIKCAQAVRNLELVDYLYQILEPEEKQIWDEEEKGKTPYIHFE